MYETGTHFKKKSKFQESRLTCTEESPKNYFLKVTELFTVLTCLCLSNLYRLSTERHMKHKYKEVSENFRLWVSRFLTAHQHC